LGRADSLAEVSGKGVGIGPAGFNARVMANGMWKAGEE
jgi:hypothetical protein